MSKKLIAVASAAAIALSALVAAPAQAAYGVSVDGTAGGTGALSTSAKTVNVPTQDEVRFDATAGDSTAAKFTVTTTLNGGSVSVSSTGAIKVISGNDYDDAVVAESNDSTIGSQSLSMTATGTTAVFYAFTTSTTAGSITISNGGNSSTYWLKGLAGAPYSITATGPTTAAKGVDYDFSVTVKDVFGNGVSGLTVGAAGLVVDNLGAFASAPAFTTGATQGTKGVYYLTATGVVAGTGLISVTLGTSKAAADLAGFSDRVLTAYLSVNSSAPETTIAALQAQVASLQAIVDRKVSKKRYNTLARKWNAAFPGQKVALKK